MYCIKRRATTKVSNITAVESNFDPARKPRVVLKSKENVDPGHPENGLDTLILLPDTTDNSAQCLLAVICDVNLET